LDLSFLLHKILEQRPAVVTWPAGCKGIGYTALLFAIPSDPTVLDKYRRNSGVMFADEKRKRFERIQEISSLLIDILMLGTDITTRKMRNGIL
jgi:hypothetical protein